jgi:hypothetical protein
MTERSSSTTLWFHVDDNLAFHPTVIELGNAAIGLWMRAGAWYTTNNADGFIPFRVAYQLGTRGDWNRLVKMWLYDEIRDGYQARSTPPIRTTAPNPSARTSSRRRHTDNNPVRRLRAVPSIDPSTSHGIKELTDD